MGVMMPGILREPKTDVCCWHITSFRRAAEFGRYPGIAGAGTPTARPIYRFTA
jgi:hypothetical protein